MSSKNEQFYIRRIAELEEQLKKRDKRIATLEKQVVELLEVNETLVKKNAELTEQVVKFSKNSSNSSKPPSSDIVKPPKQSSGTTQQSGKPIEKPKIQQTIELSDKPVTITEYRLYGFICPKCGEVLWAKLPSGVVEGQLFGFAMLIFKTSRQCAVGHHHQNMPFERTFHLG